MAVGVLLITQDDMGKVLLSCLERMWGDNLPLPVKVLPVRNETTEYVDRYCYYAKQLYTRLEEGQGVLVLTDIFGSTPSRIAASLIEQYRVRIVSGINFPMLVKIMNHETTDLDTLANIALAGGHQGILDVNKTLSFDG